MRQTVGLAGAAAATQARLADRHVGPCPHHDQGAVEPRGRRLCSRRVDDLDGLGQLCTRRDLDHDAVLHHRRVEREDGIALAEILGGEQVDQVGTPSPSTSASERTVAPSGSGIRQRGHEGAVDDDEPAAAEARPSRQLLVDRAKRALVRLGRQRKSLAQQRAQIGVMPGLDPAVRQAGGGEGPEGVVAQVTHGFRAGKPCLGRDIGIGQRHFGVGAGGDDPQAGIAITPPPPWWRNRGSRSAPVRAPVPCRRCGRSCRPTSRARCRARCSSAAAGNG